MVISHFTPHLNFGHFSMDFDSFIPPIPPNFTPGSPAIIPSSPQIMFPPVPGSNQNPNLFTRTQAVPQYSHKKETSPSLLAQNDSSLTPSSLSPPFDGTVGAKKESGAMLSDLSKQHPISNKSLSPVFDSENVLSTNENRESNQSSAGCDNSSPSPLSSATEKIPKCIGCCEPILDQFILRVAPDLEWHAHCLKCHQCSTVLDERQTCYLKDGKPYCKLDYIRLFSIRCGKCDLPFEKTDRVMRTMNKVYHVECFSCNVCFKQLLPGDEYAIRDDLIFCRDDMVELMTSSAAANANQSPNQNSLPTCENPSSAGDPRIAGIPSEQNSPKYGGMQNNSAGNNLSLSLNSSSDLDRDDKIIFSPDDKSCKDSAVSLSVRGEKRHHSSKDGSSKPTRIRTVLNEKQLHTLRTCYNANPRPDALMREQLVEMTGLSPRVIRVWFQNKRCKDKKRSIAIKQMHQLQAEKNISGLNGVPMVAGSPMRHDPVLDGQFPPYPHPPYGLPHHPHHASEMDPAYMMAFDNGGGGPGSVISDGCLGSPAGSDCSLSLSSD